MFSFADIHEIKLFKSVVCMVQILLKWFCLDVLKFMKNKYVMNFVNCLVFNDILYQNYNVSMVHFEMCHILSLFRI